MKVYVCFESSGEFELFPQQDETPVGDRVIEMSPKFYNAWVNAKAQYEFVCREISQLYKFEEL